VIFGRFFSDSGILPCGSYLFPKACIDLPVNRFGSRYAGVGWFSGGGSSLSKRSFCSSGALGIAFSEGR
jgi:hypothetical protein